jgi:hypothetical protein
MTFQARSMFQGTMLAKREMVTYFSCLDLAEHANKQEWDGEMHISAQGNHDVLQDFTSIFI